MSSGPLNRTSLGVCAATLIVAGAVLITPTSLGANMGCGEFSFGFTGTRLLNDGISDSAGPFSIELPAGTYDVVTQSHDAHDEHPGQVEQTEEQWFFTLDSGYTSPFTSDVPDDRNTVIDEFDAQVIGTSSSITLHHRGVGSVNSVDAICVGFTPTAPAREVAGPPAPVEPEAPVEIEPPVPPIEVEVKPVVIVPPTVVEPVPTTPEISVEPSTPAVVAKTPDPAPPQTELALTGPSTQTTGLLLAGVVSILGGLALVLEERRRVN